MSHLSPRTLAIALSCIANLIAEGQSTSSVAPAPEVPYVILTANKDLVRVGDTVQFTVTFANPTEKKVMLPQVSAFKGDEAEGFSQIAHTLVVTRNGSESPISALSIESSPPNFQFLAPDSKKTYNFKWTSPYEGEGAAELKFTFALGYQDSFPPIAITLKTE